MLYKLVREGSSEEVAFDLKSRKCQPCDNLVAIKWMKVGALV